jgi:methyl-accepting chemotaxis protein/hemerythrin
MERRGFSGMEAHVEEHREFQKRILDFCRHLRRGDATVADDVLHFLKDWLINHILITDAEYAPFFAEKGLS